MPHRCSAAAWKWLDSRSELRSDAQTGALCHLRLHLLLHIFERDAGGFGEHEQDHEELDHGHHGEEDERGGAGQVGHQREGEGDDGVHDPMGEAAEALALGADQVGKHFAEVDPDDGALREGEETDEADEQPDQELLALSGGKDDGHTGQTNGGAGGAGEQQFFAAQAVDHAHGDDGEEEVGGADGHGLEVAGDFVEAGALEDVVEVIEDGVDAGHLVEEADGDGEEDGAAVLVLEEGFDSGAIFAFHGADDVGDFAIGVGFADAGKNLAGLLDETAADQPARALRDAEEVKEEEQRGQGGHAEFPAPLFGAETHGADHVVRQVRDQNPRDDIELEEADEASAFGGGRNLGDIHGADH